MKNSPLQNILSDTQVSIIIDAIYKAKSNKQDLVNKAINAPMPSGQLELGKAYPNNYLESEKFALMCEASSVIVEPPIDISTIDGRIAENFIRELGKYYPDHWSYFLKDLINDPQIHTLIDHVKEHGY